MTQEQIKAKAKEYFPNDEFKQQIVIDVINWATKELEKENAELKEKLGNYQKGMFDEIEKRDKQHTKKDKRIAELEAQIEKMKDCRNCDNWSWKHSRCEKKLKGDCFKHSKWVMRNF